MCFTSGSLLDESAVTYPSTSFISSVSLQQQQLLQHLQQLLLQQLQHLQQLQQLPIIFEHQEKSPQQQPPALDMVGFK